MHNFFYKTALGFDFGTKYIGVAVGQTLTKTAKPLTSIYNIEGTPDWKNIKKIIAEWQPHVLIVGVPVNMDGTPQPITFLAQQFCIQLGKQTQLPVFEIDERLTTVEARSQIFSHKGSKGLTKAAIDSYSAKLILEDWLSQYSV